MSSPRASAGGRNRELETGSQLALLALLVVACFAGIPPIVEVVTQAITQARIDAAPMRFACKSCGVVEDVHVVTLGAAKHDVSTVSGEGFAMFVALVSGKLSAGPVSIYEIAVRLQDGSMRVLREATLPAWQPGDRVKVVMGRIRPAS